MPFSSLHERDVVAKITEAFKNDKDLATKKEYQYFYKQLPTFTYSNIVDDKDVRFATSKLRFRVKILGKLMPSEQAKRHGLPARPTHLEKYVEFTVDVCNNEKYAQLSGGQYLYFPEAGADYINDENAFAFAQVAAGYVYGGYCNSIGYTYTGCEVFSYDYLERNIREYTEYTFAYDYAKGTATVRIIGDGDTLHVVDKPLPYKKKWGWLLGAIIVVAVVAIVVVAVSALQG